jgi:hypothetical protein
MFKCSRGTLEEGQILDCHDQRCQLSSGRMVSRSSAGLSILPVPRSTNHESWKLFRASQILSTGRCIDEFFEQSSVHDVVMHIADDCKKRSLFLERSL